ncbi:YqaE/Pmp3 family membrane protein [Candidatus Sumerlaeota bacterium]|nr:YqaE/Pmp3 family membrane protein [Candidatus Sumerlaeota bacterium]
MRYFLAILLPPLAILLCGRIVAFLLNVALLILILGLLQFAHLGSWAYAFVIIHALLVVHSHLADLRARRLAGMIKKAL